MRMQAKGALQAAQGSQPLPPFERWSMAGPRYVQFLVDLLHVHRALEAAVASAPSVAALKHFGGSVHQPTLLEGVDSL